MLSELPRLLELCQITIKAFPHDGKNLLKAMLLCLFHYQHFWAGQFSLLVGLKAALPVTENSRYLSCVTPADVRNPALAAVSPPWAS